MISDRAGINPSQQVAGLLRDAIRAGKLAPGDRLKSARALAQRYDVSLTTAVRAVEELRREGLVETQRGRGTYVRRTPELVRYGSGRYRRNTGPSSPNLIEGGDSGWPVRISGEISTEDASAEVAHRLGITPGDPVSVVHYYARTTDQEMVQFSTQWEPLAITRGTESEVPPASGEPDVITRMDAIGVHISQVTERARPRMPTADEARLLALPPHVPVHEIVRTHYDNDGQAVETADIVIRGDRVTTVTVHSVE